MRTICDVSKVKSDDVKTDVSFASGSVQEVPTYCLGGIRHKDGASPDQAFVRNVGTCRCDEKGEVQVVTHEDESTNAWHRDGLARSSDEICESRWSKGARSFSLPFGTTA